MGGFRSLGLVVVSALQTYPICSEIIGSSYDSLAMSMLGMLVPLSRISQEGTDSESRKKTKTKAAAYITVHWFFQPPATKSPGFNPLKGPHWLLRRRIRTASAAGCAAVQQRRPWGIPMGYCISTGDREMVYIEQKTHDILWNRKIMKYYYTYLFIHKLWPYCRVRLISHGWNC